jgi:AcrR family transcriptional regulator
MRHGTIDMDALATSLAISRATLYRVVHSRDQLLGDVLWRLAEQELTTARAARTRPGVDGMVEVTQRFCSRLLHSAPYRTFLAAEPQTAARVLFTRAGGVHSRVVAAQKEIMLECADESQPWPAGDLDSLAYLYVRIVESMLYAELLTGRPPDAQLTERAVRSLFQIG